MTLFEQRMSRKNEGVVHQGKLSSSRMDTFQRLARQVDGGVARSADGYGIGKRKRVDSTTGAESQQHSNNKYLDDLQRRVPKPTMCSGRDYVSPPPEFSSTSDEESDVESRYNRYQKTDHAREDVDAAMQYYNRPNRDYSYDNAEPSGVAEQGHHDAGASSQGNVDKSQYINPRAKRLLKGAKNFQEYRIAHGENPSTARADRLRKRYNFIIANMHLSEDIFDIRLDKFKINSDNMRLKDKKLKKEDLSDLSD